MISENASRSQWRQYVFKLSLPIMVSNSTVPLVGIVDTAVMSRMGSPEWIAATAIGSVIFSSLYWMFSFLRMGTGGLVAQSYGASDHQEVGRILARASLLAMSLATLLLVTQTQLRELSLFAMQDKEASWKPLTEIYFNIRIYSAPATLLTYVVIATLVGMQKMRQVLVLQLLLNLLNIVLTIALFNYTTLGIAGVALATVISEYVALAYGLFLLAPIWKVVSNNRPYAPWVFDPHALRKLFSVSRDLFIRTASLIFAYYWISVLGSRQGVAVLAANSVLMHLVNFSTYAMDGYAHAAETLTGYAVGQKSQRFFREAIRAAALLGVLTSLVFVFAYALGGPYLLTQLSAEKTTQQLALQWLPWIALVPVVSIGSFLLDGIFAGATETASMRDSVIQSLVVFMIAVTLLVPLLGNHGLWLSYHCLLIARALTLWRYWPKVIRATLPPARYSTA